MSNISPARAESVAAGCKVSVTNRDAGKEISFAVVRPNEADPTKGKLSTEAPVAQAVLGQSVGDDVVAKTPRGLQRLRITEVTEAGGR